MGTIEITTTQNVTIEYELATVRDRILAFVIDLIIIWASIFILMATLGLAFPKELNPYLTYLVAVPIFLFYSLLSEFFGNGRSWGKKALGLKVVKINGTEGEASDYLIRWTFRMVDIYFSLGSVAALLISSTAKAQRLGDLVANTTVIKIKPTSNLLLKDIMKINSLQNYAPRYPEVKQMKDSEMLVVKNVLERWKQYPNAAHKEAVKELVNVLCSRLNITEQIKEPIPFLRTLLNDYIVLTR